MLYKISTEETSSMSNSNFLELGVEIDYYLNADHFDACRPWRETVGRNGVVCSVVWYGIRSRAIEIGRNHPAEAVFLAVRVSHRQHFNDLSSPSWSVYLKVDSERKQANYHSNQEAIFKHLLLAQVDTSGSSTINITGGGIHFEIIAKEFLVFGTILKRRPSERRNIQPADLRT